MVSPRRNLFFVSFIAFVLSISQCWAINTKVIYTFVGSGFSGESPVSKLINLDGKLYGTLLIGPSACGCGAVFELSQHAGAWNYRTIYAFKKGIDGGTPQGDLTVDAAGNLYGATYDGGVNGSGTVYQLSRNASGVWTEQVLYRFKSDPDAANPISGVALDASGNLYGGTFFGGAYGMGAIYKLAKEPDGRWSESVIYSFDGSNNLSYPTSAITADVAGNVFGVTQAGGDLNLGTLFELVQGSSGSWNLQILHSFAGRPDAASPTEPVWIDGAGNIFGMTTDGGGQRSGTIFQSQASRGQWEERVIHSFGSFSDDAVLPSGPLTPGPGGSLFGCANRGGDNNLGAVFSLSRAADGSWNEAPFFSFQGAFHFPVNGVTFARDGGIFGFVQANGVDSKDLSIYEITR